MEELSLNLHMHTTYSDGSGSHQVIADAALRTGLDVVIVTDHNVLVSGLDGYYQQGSKRLLLLVGEEVHNRTRWPQKSHLLVIGAPRDMAPFAPDPQHLIDQVQRAGGLSFIAHPHEAALPMFNEPNISWDDWHVQGYTGIELWNGLSELKEVIHNPLDALYYAFFPQLIAHGPNPATLSKWDMLTAAGKRVVAVGGSDAHQLTMRMGPFRRTIFPYEFHFRAVNTHLLAEHALTGDLAEDRRVILEALRAGHVFVGYDYFQPTRGFSFTAQSREKTVIMGDEITLTGGITLQIRLPGPAECRLIKDGQTIKVWTGREIYSYIANQPGVYRVECYTHMLGGEPRGWIYSNPIYIRPPSY